MKTCSKCNTTYISVDENFSKSKKYGYHSYCKSCQKEYWVKYYANKTETIKANRQIRYHENKDAEISRVIKYQKDNPEKVKRIKTKHSQTRSSHIVERVKRWRRNNPLHAKMLRIIERSVNIDITIENFTSLYSANEIKDNLYQCNICKKELRFSETTIDHIVPLSKNGDNSISNLQILCFKCNVKKSNK